MTVNEFFEHHCRADVLKIFSGFNGKVLCRAFNPKKHIEIGEREILSIWVEIEPSKSIAYGNIARPIMCAYADGRKEYEREGR